MKKYKRGYTREDGMVVKQMKRGKPYWTTRQKFDDMISREKNRCESKKKLFAEQPCKYTRGDTRPQDNKIFWARKISCIDFEHWVTPEKFTKLEEARLLRSHIPRNRQKELLRQRSPHFRQQRRRKIKEKRVVDPLFRLKCLLMTRISDAFRHGGYTKKSRSNNILGCSFSELSTHIESQFTDGMSWENQGRYGWHVDHRLPLAAATTADELVSLCHYTNLQPMWAKDNQIKGDTYCHRELEVYLDQGS